jgi:E3 ubiquitin-protein ligase TRIP12
MDADDEIRRFDDDDGDDLDLEDEDVEMAEASSLSAAKKGRRSSIVGASAAVAGGSKQKRKGKETPKVIEVADPEAGAGPSPSTVSTDQEGSTAAAVKTEHNVEVAEHRSSDSEGDNDHDDEDDDEDDDDEDEDDEGHSEDYVDEEDDFIEEYETSLGLHGEERDEYGTEGEEDMHEAPRTFNADGDPLSEGADAEGALDEADAAFLSALSGVMRGEAGAGGGGSGGPGGAGSDDLPGGMGGLGGISAFRALHGMMSGNSTRLKGLLEALRKQDGDGQAKLLALQDLAELLSISTEDTLGGYFQLSAFVKELVAILRGDSNGMSVSGGGGGGNGDSGMTVEEALAFGLDPAEVVGGGGGGDTEENDVQMMLLACRCLANLMEALPGSAHSVVAAGAVPILCAKLKDIQYIDLAEQTLSTLEKISEEVPSSIVREGGLSALLSYIDFFSFHVQRTAITAAANCCRSLSLESFDRVVEVIPIFKNILGYPDQRVVEQACLAIVRIVDSYRYYPDKLEQLLSKDLIVAIKAIINPDSTTVSASTYTQCLKMLTTAVKASPAVAINLVELDIAHTLYHLLTGVAPPEWKSDEGKQALDSETTAEDNMLVMQNLVQRPNEVAEVLNLVTELLPPLPKDGVFDSRAFSGKERSSSSKTAQKAKKVDTPPAAPASSVKREEDTPDLASAPAPSAVSSEKTQDLAADVKMEGTDDVPVAAAAAGPSSATVANLRAPALGRVSSSSSSRSKSKARDPNKEAMIAKRLELVSPDAPPSRKLVVKRYIALLLPTLIDVYAASVSPSVRTKAVNGMLKMVNYCEEDALADVLHTVPFAAFISAILSTRENQAPLMTSALQLVELLLLKMRDAYQYTFRREGVMHEIERLAQRALVSPNKSKRSSPSRTPRGEGDVDAAAAPSGIARALLSQPDVDTKKMSPSELQAYDAVTLRARHLSDTYGAPDSEPSVRAQAVLERIKALVQHVDSVAHADVGSGGAKAVAKIEREAKEALEEIAGLFADEKNPLSSFEMLESGLVDGVLKFATETGTGPRTSLLIYPAYDRPELTESSNSLPSKASRVARRSFHASA